MIFDIGWRIKRRKIFELGIIKKKRRRKMEKEQGENIWRREIFFAEKNKKGEGKGGKYLGKENIHLRRRKKHRRK